MSPPSTFPQRWKNDAAILQYLAAHTDIPLPRLQCVCEDDGAFYHFTELVKGVTMDSLGEEDKAVVTTELLQHVATLKSLRSDTPGVSGTGEEGGLAQALLCTPERVSNVHWTGQLDRRSKRKQSKPPQDIPQLKHRFTLKKNPNMSSRRSRRLPRLSTARATKPLL
jgi:hypothetical protein